MSGYAATERIRGVAPRWVEAGHERLLPDPPSRSTIDDLSEVVPGAGDHLDPPVPSLGERWEAARERWSQLTFYLFDPPSWR